MKLKSAVLILSIILILATFNIRPSKEGAIIPTTGTFEKYGPRVYDLIFKVGGDLSKEAYDLESGAIDVMDWAAPSGSVSTWLANPDILMGEYSEFGWYEYDLNLQMWPIGHGAMDGVIGPRPPAGSGGEGAAVWEFPATWDPGHYWINYTCQRCLDSREFRRALAHLTNRAAMSAHMMGFGAMMETFIFPAISSWENPAAPKYPFSLDTARTILYNAGFRDYDGDKKLEYSKDRTIAKMEELPELQFYIREDDPDRRYAGELLRDYLMLLGVPMDWYITSRAICFDHAWSKYDYSIYTGGWGWGRVPDNYYEIWHSSKDTYPLTNADNYNRYHSKEYDPWAEQFKTAATADEAKTALFKAQEILHRDVACIPLYTFSSYVAHRAKYYTHVGEEKYAGRPWEGYVNEKGYAFYGGAVAWSTLNVHPQGFPKGGTLRRGLLIDILKFDPVDAEWFYDWEVLSTIYDPLIAYHPYDVTKYIPWLAKNYTVEPYFNATTGKTVTKMRFYLVPNVLWHDDVEFNATDVGFTWWYYKATLSVPHIAAVGEFDYYKIIDKYTVDIFFKVQSWLAEEWTVGVPIIPWHIWKDIPPTLPGDPTPGGSWAYDPETANTVIGTGPFRCFKDGVVGKVDRVLNEYVHLQANPTYFRKFIWPDVADITHTPGKLDKYVGLDDFGEVAKPGNIFKSTKPDGTWPDPPGAWGPYCDVDKDGKIGISDLMEIGVHFGEVWPPFWYV